jgi:hypothetical protein
LWNSFQINTDLHRNQHQYKSIILMMNYASIWNALYTTIWRDSFNNTYISGSTYLGLFLRDIWRYYFTKPIDELPHSSDEALQEIRLYFFTCIWYEVYNFIESVAYYGAKHLYRSHNIKNFTDACNEALDRQFSGYRFVRLKVAPITSNEEIREVEEALDTNKYVESHLDKALKHLSEKESPDYPNSAKESISAVEAMCALIAEDNNASLGDALGIIQRKSKIELHKALRDAFDKLYGYTSNADGIRHANLDVSSFSFEDAKFMLVSCSAFINYLKVKVSKAGIEI